MFNHQTARLVVPLSICCNQAKIDITELAGGITVNANVARANSFAQSIQRLQPLIDCVPYSTDDVSRQTARGHFAAQNARRYAHRPLSQFLYAVRVYRDDEAGAIPFPSDVPFDVASIIGCAVVTGINAVVNTVCVTAASSPAVIGCGGGALSAIQGCKLAGCYPIVTVDVMPSKLGFVRRMGATETMNASETQVVKALCALTHGSPD